MKLAEISSNFLKWEKEEALYELLHNDFPLYALIRPQLYEALLLGSDPVDVLIKDTGQTKVRLNYYKLAMNILSFILKIGKLKTRVIGFSNAENRRYNGQEYYDIYFDKIMKFTGRRS